MSPIGLALVFSGPKRAEATDGTDPAAPVVMEMDAVTLELVCRDGATEGEFHPIRSRIIEATTWGGNQQSHADLAGYTAQPGGRARGKQAKRAKNNPAAQQQAAITILVTLKPSAGTSAGDAILEIDTAAGTASIRLQDIDFGTPRHYLDGKISVQRLPSATRFAASPSDNDYPAAARGREGAYGWPMLPTSAAANRTWPPPPAAIFASRSHGQWRSDSAREVRRSTVVGADARHRTDDGSLEAYGNGWRGGEGLGRLEPERRAATGISTAETTTRRRTTGRQSNASLSTRAPMSTLSPPPIRRGKFWWAWQGRRGKHFKSSSSVPLPAPTDRGDR